MTIKRVFVCDDVQALADEWIANIQATLREAVVSRIDDPGNEFRALLRRIPDTGAAADGRESEASAFDQADVLVVDYDLLHVDPGQARHTGEGFARMARLYSDCGFVIVLNQFATVADFDLELTGHLGSFADLNIASEFVGSPALWGEKRDGTDFAPWSWPDIVKTIELRTGLTQRLLEHIDKPLLEAIEFPVDKLGKLSDEAIGFLSPPVAPTGDEEMPPSADRVTVAQFLNATNEHREIARARQSCPTRAARAATARLAKWYSRSVLGPQDLLVDVPHLLQRMPFLLHREFGDTSLTETWNAAVEAGGDALSPIISKFRFEPALRWTGRDAYWWPEIAASLEVSELRSDFKPEDYPDIVFAEDASAFISYQDATAFRAGFHNQFDVRYIRHFQGVNYGPARRLAAV